MAPKDALFFPEHAGLKIVSMRRELTELWRFEDFFIPIFMNFDELNIIYEFILSNISSNGLKTHALSWLRNNKIHIIGPRHYIRTECRYTMPSAIIYTNYY